MYKKVFLLFLLLHYVYCQQVDSTTAELKRENYSSSFIYIFGCTVTLALIRHLIRVFEIEIPYSFLCISIGILWGVGEMYSELMKRMAQVSSELILSGITFVYLPPVIFSMGFCIDVHSFIRSLPQILVISVPVSLLSAITTASMMKLLIDPNWSLADTMLFGSLFALVYPTEVFRVLRQNTAHSKHVKVLLEGETLITACWSLYVYRFIVNYLEGWIVRWYQFVMGFVRMFGLGIPLGYIYGRFGAALMLMAYSDQVGLVVITVGVCYTGYFYTQWIARGGIISTVMIGMLMGLQKDSLPSDKEKNLLYFWKTVRVILAGILFMNAGELAPQAVIDLYMKDGISVVVTYLVTNITRLVSFFLFAPIFSRVGYGMSLTDIGVCVLGGLKNPYSINMAVRLIRTAYRDQQYKAKLFFFHTIGVYMLMLLINGSCFSFFVRVLGLSDITISRQISMNNCIKYINDARSRTLRILKMDRFLADANWPLVMTCTTLQHPYRKILEKKHQRQQALGQADDLLGHKYTFCPDCQKDVPNEPTPKELREMTKEAKMRILKLKKTAYTRQFENGMLSTHGFRILQQAVEVATDTEKLVIELDGLFKLFTKEGIFYRFCRDRVVHSFSRRDEGSKPPRRQARLWCYRIVNHDAFSLCMYVMVLTHLGVLTYHSFYGHQFEKFFFTVMFLLRFTYFFVYLVEFFLKIMALSWIYICKHGFSTYFRSYWYWIEFMVLLLSFATVILEGVKAFSGHVTNYIYVDGPLIVLLGIRSLQMVSLLKYCEFCRALIPALIKYLDVKIYRHRALAFELAKSYVSAEEEILENLHQIVDNDKIRAILKERIDNDRLAVTRRLGVAQKESSDVAMMVKTKLAMMVVLNSMKQDVNDLKVSGWVDDIEYQKLIKSLTERSKFIHSTKTVPVLSPKQLLKEIPYMCDDTKIVEYLYSNVVSKRFDPGEVVYKEGDVADAIYVLISGMFVVTYTPTTQILERMNEIGSLPIIDFIYSYQEETSEYILPGNTVGELSLVTGRSYDGIVTSVTHSQVCVLSRASLIQAFAMNRDPVDGLECRIWKYISFKKAHSVLMTIPSYRSLTQEKMKYVLERSFVPNLSNYKIFLVNNMMADLILIEGAVVDFNTQDVYSGTCYIPRAVQKLILPKSSTISVATSVETKLLIIPSKDVDEYEIMVTEERTCQLVDNDSKMCLRHLIQQQGWLDKSKGTKHMRAIVALQEKNSSELINEFDPPSMMVTPRQSKRPSRRPSVLEPTRPASADSALLVKAASEKLSKLFGIDTHTTDEERESYF